jgi:3-methyladenine DNA glycosylase AlkD
MLVEEIQQRLAATRPFTTANVRAVRREYSKRLKHSPGRDVVALALSLLASDTCRWFGYELILHHQQAAASLGSRDVERLGHGIHSWDTVDAFGLYIAGPAWRERQIPDSVIHRWARSRDLWWRRAALVATVALNMAARGGSGDTPRTLRVCRMLVADREDMVVKALSWALRAMALRDPAAARRFLAQHQARLAARVLREVRNKLTIGLKNP